MSSTTDSSLAIDLRPLSAASPEGVEALLDRGFGADRRARTAYRIRRDMAPIAALSAGMFADGCLLASIQCWPIALHLDAGGAAPLIMVGPVAVEPVRQGTGLGRALMVHALAVADRDFASMPLMLIGDPDYYGRFGFAADCTQKWRAPGPVEAHRLLARGGTVTRDAGMLGPRG